MSRAAKIPEDPDLIDLTGQVFEASSLSSEESEVSEDHLVFREDLENSQVSSGEESTSQDRKLPALANRHQYLTRQRLLDQQEIEEEWERRRRLRQDSRRLRELEDLRQNFRESFAEGVRIILEDTQFPGQNTKEN